MLPYILLLFVPLLFSCVSFSYHIAERNRKWTIVIGQRREVLEHSCVLPVFFLLFIILLSLRDETIGRDLDNYRLYFYHYAALDIEDIFTQEKTDILYWLLTWAIGQLTNNYQIFLAVVAIITVLPISYVYGKDRKHGFLKMVLFMNMSIFVMIFSGLRQAIAISVGLIAYEFVKKKQFIGFLIAALIAFGFHHTGFMVFLFYPLYHMTIKTKHLWFVIPGMLVFYGFKESIFTWGTDMLNRLAGEKYEAEITETGAYTMLILFILFAVFVYLIPDEKNMDPETLGLRNFLLMTVILQCFAPIHALAMRMNYYFIIFIPILIPKIISTPRENTKEMAWIAKYVMLAFFVAFYLITTYVSCQTGISDLDTYPYVPFWK